MVALAPSRRCCRSRLGVGDGGEGAAADGLAGDDREEDLDQVEPGAGGRGEVQVIPGLRASHAVTPGACARRSCHHDVQLTRAGRRWRPVEEGAGTPVAVTLVAGVGDLAGGDLQRREQGGGAVPDVVVGAPLGSPGRSGRIGAVGPAPGSGTSRPRTAPPPSPAGRGTARRRRGSWPPAAGSVENLNDQVDRCRVTRSPCCRRHLVAVRCDPVVPRVPTDRRVSGRPACPPTAARSA